jgi:hypothetical protein
MQLHATMILVLHKTGYLTLQENLRPRKKGEKEAVERIKREAQVAGASLQEASKHTLNLLADNRPHQVSLLLSTFATLALQSPILFSFKGGLEFFC